MNSNCYVCGHERLLHDSWGCKMKCGCGVSVIYLTPVPFSELVDKVVEDHLIERGIKLVATADRVEELRIRGIYEQATVEQEPDLQELL